MIKSDIARKLWLSILAFGSILVTFLSYIYPRQFYDEYIWQYLWGPIVADSYGLNQVYRTGGETHLTMPDVIQFVAEPGYTLFSTITYIVILVYLLIGISLYLDVSDVKIDKNTIISLVPIMVFGGILRVIEDLNVAYYNEFSNFIITYPYNTLLISPLIYFSLFVFTSILFIIGIQMEKKGFVEQRDNFVLHSGLLTLISGILFTVYLTTEIPTTTFNYNVLIITLGLTIIISGLYWVISQRYYPKINEGTGILGIFIIGSHTLDGVVNVIGLDWTTKLGIPLQYEPKHIANEGVQIITSYIQPSWLSDTIGITWPFVFLKIFVSLYVVYVFDKEFIEDSRLLSYILLVAIIAVGLGPGVRDLVRIIIGI